MTPAVPSISASTENAPTRSRNSRPLWSDLSSEYQPHIDAWSQSWQALGLESGFEARIHVGFNTRLRRTLGRCRLAEGRIELASLLVEAPHELVLEVLCHEAAHAAVYEVHGRGARPHGAEWRGLMNHVGFEPRTRFPVEALPETLRARTRVRLPWAHRCPVCAMTRRTRTRRLDWRCSRCMAAGRSGRLVIERLEDTPANPKR